MSLLNGAHLTLFPRVASLLKKRGVSDILLIGGGVIPVKDKKLLEEKGVKGNFGPGTPLDIIIKYIHNNLKK
jgi:methylmalonyl-CoA mutase C-terminal domain/subunit